MTKSKTSRRKVQATSQEEAPVVVHVSTVHPANDNRILYKECRALSEAGYRVILIAQGVAQMYGVEHIPLTSRRGRVRRIVSGYRDVWRALRRAAPDLLHIHDPELIPLAALWRIRYRCPVVYDAHEDLPGQIVSKPYIARGLRPWAVLLAEALERLADFAMSAIVIAEPALRVNYARNRNVYLVQNFPWLSEFPKPAPLPQSEPTAVYVGAINLARGAREMMAAVQAAESRPRLILAGTASPPSLGAELHAAGENVLYLGQVDAIRVPEIISRAHLGLCLLHPEPNYVNAQSTKIFEYMAAGRPFLYSNFPSWMEMFEQFDAGIAVDPRNVNQIAHEMDRLLGDADLGAQMGARGRQALLDHFTFEKEAAALSSLVQRLLLDLVMR